MTIGIYALVFEGTDKVYIGQSIHIEVRYEEHIRSYINGYISPKLKDAFNTYGRPYLEILEIAPIIKLDSLEEIYIREFNSVNNGFNYLHRSFALFIGDRHPNSVISNEEVEQLLFFIINNQDKKLVEVSKVTGISVTIIENITSLKSHTWLKEKYLLEYSMLEKLKGTRRANTRLRRYYPVILCPSGTEYSITNAKEFASIHGLNHSHLVGVLNGRERSHKGWRLKGNIS